MSLFVDTSVWSLALRRDRGAAVAKREVANEEVAPEVRRLRRALLSEEPIFTTGLVFQELLQGFHGARAHDAIVERFAALPFLVPDRRDHAGAADLRNECRRRGIQLETIDALLTRLCIKHELTMLSTDRDFEHAARCVPLHVWRA